MIGTRAAPSLSFTDAVLGGVTYHYVVSAVNVIGESPDSAPVSAARDPRATAGPGRFVRHRR